jgi:hypothetical protein
LVPKASETCEAISDSRGALTWPKPSARAFGAVDHGVDGQLQAAGFQLFDDAVARLHDSMAASGLAITSFAPLAKAAGRPSPLRVLLDELGRGDDGVAVELHAEVG